MGPKVLGSYFGSNNKSVGFGWAFLSGLGWHILPISDEPDAGPGPGSGRHSPCEKNAGQTA